MGLDVLKGGLSWGQTTDAGTGSEIPAVCTQAVLGRRGTHIQGWGKGRGITGREAPVPTHTDAGVSCTLLEQPDPLSKGPAGH